MDVAQMRPTHMCRRRVMMRLQPSSLSHLQPRRARSVCNFASTCATICLVQLAKNTNPL